MTWSTFQGILAAITVFGFIFFAFRQGMRVKPSRNDGGSDDSGYIPPSDGPSHH